MSTDEDSVFVPFKRKFDPSTDPAYKCPYCGGRNCEFEDSEAFPMDGFFDHSHLHATFFCLDCQEGYDVDFELVVSEVLEHPDAEEREKRMTERKGKS